MPRSVENSSAGIPGSPDNEGWRHFGDGTAGRIRAARIQGYDPTSLGYVDVQVDSNGVVQTAGGGSGGGGAVTVADGADVAQGATTDVAWMSGAGSLIAISKAEFAKLEAIRAQLASSVAVTGPLTDTQLRASAVPVSLATNTPDVTDRAARLLGHVTVDSAPTTAVTGPLTDTQLRASAVPVSLAAETTKVIGVTRSADGSGNLLTSTAFALDVNLKSGAIPAGSAVIGHVIVDTAPSTAVTNAGTFAVQAAATLAAETTKVIGVVRTADGSGNLTAVKAASSVAAATDPALVVQHAPQRADAANLCVTNTAATGVACTLTIPAAGAGLFHYISLVEIQLYATAARTGGATPVLVTTTNLPGSPVWDFDTAQAIGVTIRQATQPATPVKSSVANTATTVVAPIATTGIWRITAYYYAAP